MTRSAVDWVRLGKGGDAVVQYQWFLLRNASDYPDSTLCRAWNWKTGKEGSSDVHVAKPWDIRRATSDGKTMPNGVAYSFFQLGNLTRRATKGSVSEIQIVTPPYLTDALAVPNSMGSVIRAVRGIRGGTGAMAEGKRIEWQECSGRHFASQESETLIADATVAGITVGNSQNNFGARRDPGPDDGGAFGWGVGSQWINVVTGGWFVCVDPAIGAALWRELGAGGSGGGITDAEYEVATAHAGLSAERVTTDVARGGIKTDFGTPGQVKRTVTCGVFVTDASGAGTISAKVFESNTIPGSKVLQSFTSDSDVVDVGFELEGWPGAWLPDSITVYGGVAPVTIARAAFAVAAASGGAEMAVADTGDRRWTGKIRINATANSTIYMTTPDGGQSQNVAYTRALNPPNVLTAIFATQTSGIYPGAQTQFGSGQTARCTGTTQSHATHVYVKVFEATTGRTLQGPFTVTAGAFDFTLTIGNPGNVSGQHLKVYAVNGIGSTAGADFQTTNTCICDQTAPILTGGAQSDITYNGASGQEALKGTESATVTVTHTNIAGGDTYLYDRAGFTHLDSIPNPTTYAVTKTVTRNGASGTTYSETTYNYRLTVTRTTLNGYSTAQNVIVKIAAVAPVITITDAANAAMGSGPPTVGRMGTDNGTLGYRDWTVKIRSNQTVLQTYTPSLTVGATDPSTWQGSWVKNGPAGAELDYTRALRVADAGLKAGGQAANNYTWGACSVKNRAGMEAVGVTTNTTYALGGFQTRTLTQAAAPVHKIAVGCRAVNTAKLIAVNLSKGGSPTQAFEVGITEHNNANPALNDFFTIATDASTETYQSDGSAYHNSDKLFSDSNSSGTAQISLQETA